ncbi:MAG: thiol:disulfide interchange protein DsbA/DsbL [Burkholderiaceae bacterium]
MTSLLRRSLIAAALLVPALSFAQTPAPVAGKDYSVVKPAQPTDNPGKIEVLEFFAYTCPHCMTYEPVMKAWKKTLPGDVEVKSIPVAFDERGTPYVKIFYALEALNKLDALHTKVFDAVINQRRRLEDPNAIADFMATNGIDRKQWLDAYNSFSVAGKTNRAAQTWKAYRIDGTPGNAVAGKYMTAPSMVGSREGATKVMDYLIAQERAAKGKK